MKKAFQVLIFCGLLSRAFAQEPVVLQEKPVHAQRNSIFKAAFDSSNGFDVLHYRLDLNFPLVTDDFSGVSTLTILNEKKGRTALSLHSQDLVIDSVFVQGNPASFESDDPDLRVRFNPSIAAGETFEVRIVYHHIWSTGGFYHYAANSYTHSEPIDARRWFPCLDVPWDKATAEIHATVPKGVKVASNGLLEGIDTSDDGLQEIFHWRTEYPVATYLFCVTMSSEYAQWSDWYVNTEGDSIEMPYYIHKADSALAVVDFANMTEAMAFFSDYFGEYPFEKYGTAEVAPYVAGGMEHQSMTTINSVWIQGDRSYETGLVHELAHMWWGDAVTLNDWPAIWLNEGFASYSEVLWLEYFYNQAAADRELSSARSYYFSQAMNRDFPIYNPPEDQLFNWGIVYNKGALVLHMLRQVTGDDAFKEILQRYYATYRYGNASIPEFREVCESVYGEPLDWFFNQWIYGSGYPHVQYAWETAAAGDGTDVRLYIVQAQQNANAFRFPLDVRMSWFGGQADTMVWVMEPVQEYLLHAHQSPQTILLDKDNKVILTTDEVAWEALSPQFPTASYQLYPNYPNPFNTETQLTFYIPQSLHYQRVSVRIYDVTGRLVIKLLDEIRSPGRSTVSWDGTDDNGMAVPSGVYVAELQAMDFIRQRKMVLTR